MISEKAKVKSEKAKEKSQRSKLKRFFDSQRYEPWPVDDVTEIEYYTTPSEFYHFF